ncbi:unnamed protein product [Lymnaea stagnalis]|uniref:Uncharacterized protein n=1 Tax=Lymnaea stagnalis TaxID=6523 RepID=A0AAV2H0P8_LYMST
MATTTRSEDAKVFLLYLTSSAGDVNKVLDFSGHQGVTLDTRDGSGRNSLDLARQHGDRTAMTTLMAVGDQLRLPNNTTPTRTHLLEHTTDPIAHAQDHDNLRVVQIHEAARFGDLDLLQYALHVLAVHIDHTTADGVKALKLSMLKGDVVAVRCLLSAGAKIAEEDVQLAKSVGNQSIIQLLEVCRAADE